MEIGAGEYTLYLARRCGDLAIGGMPAFIRHPYDIILRLLLLFGFGQPLFCFASQLIEEGVGVQILLRR